ncbi:MAG TPA: hypothetical protein VGR35_19645 [Tepidisphaeraceae bacterium]|nr:hypothetical protein [Tepidisphaeraceae bacterium]
MIISAVLGSLLLSALTLARRFAKPSAPYDAAMVKMLGGTDMKYYPRSRGMYFVVELPAARPSNLNPPSIAFVRRLALLDVRADRVDIPSAEPTRLGVARTFVIRWVAAEQGAQGSVRWEWDGCRWEISVPWWYPFVGGLMFPLFYLGPWRGPWLRYRRMRRGLCGACGYDLRATPAQCSECGAMRGDAQATK